MKKGKLIISIIIIILLAGAGYWFFKSNQPLTINDPSNDLTNPGYSPFDRPGTTNTPAPTNIADNNSGGTSTASVQKIASLRLLSNMPVGGYGASTTASTTVIRWIERGRGNILQTNVISTDVQLISNTLLPRMYSSVWGKNLISFIGTVYQEGAEDTEVLYADILIRENESTSTPADFTPYELRGKTLPSYVITYASSPKKDKVFFVVKENSKSVGYISSFNGRSVEKIFESPLTQIIAEWPEENTIAITTKGNSTMAGYLYFVSPKTGIWTKVAGPLNGLTTKVSHDAKYFIASYTDVTKKMITRIYSVTDKNEIDPLIATIADKCTWGNMDKNLVYCGVPSEMKIGSYPEDWYKGVVYFSDKIWQVNAADGSLHLVSSIVDKSDRIIDAINLSLSDNDDYLFFMNKNDLSLWSIDLNTINN